MSNSILQYGEDPLQKIKQFSYNESYTKTIIFIHGGAWRDPNNTYDDFAEMAGYLISNMSPINIFSINYRLSPKFKHPYHLLDLLYALRYLNQNFKLGTVSILGHSVGATLALQLLNFDSILNWGVEDLLKTNEEFKNGIPTKDDLDQLYKDITRLNLKKLFLLDGIFDNAKLIDEYGASYKTFVDDAFVSTEHYVNAFQLSTSKPIDIHQHFKDINIKLLYSKEDELLSESQTRQLQDYFDNHRVSYTLEIGSWGKHEEEYKSTELSRKVADSI